VRRDSLTARHLDPGSHMGGVLLVGILLVAIAIPLGG
jgi:hypothetical protein